LVLERLAVPVAAVDLAANGSDQDDWEEGEL